MNSIDLLRMSIGNLFRRKTRTILTLLGVVIGTSSIVVMLSLGIAMDRSFKEHLQQMGNLNVIRVNGSGYISSNIEGRNTEEVELNDNAVAMFEKIPGVQAVMPIKRTYMRVAAGRMVGDISIIGIKPETMAAFDFKIDEGRLLLETDKDVMVFGSEVAYQFYNPRLRSRTSFGRRFNGEKEPPPVNLINNNLLLTSNMSYGERRRQDTEQSQYEPPKPHKVKGVGILAEGQNESSWNAYMNIAALEDIIAEDKRARHESIDNRKSGEEDQYQEIKVKVASIEQVEQVQEQIKNMGFQANSLIDMLNSMKETSKKMQAILGGIGAVSLLVAAIGITNTMIMSIYERTREIGVIKVLGANLADIKKLFLMEAAMIGFGGGVMGVLFSYLVSFGLNKISVGFMGRADATGISVISVGLALSAVAFSTLVGIIAGYSPAHRAMKLSALEAIRVE